jgi:quercetin dioxygenase-like cupin family protein
MTIDTTDRARHPHVAAGEARTLRVLGDELAIALPEEATGGAFALFEVRSPPGGGAAPLHTHPPQETFYVLEGDYEVYGAGPGGPYAIRAAAGDVVHVPGGAPHGYRNVGDLPGRMLAVFEPPGRMLELFEALDGEPPERVAEIAGRYGLLPASGAGGP